MSKEIAEWPSRRYVLIISRGDVFSKEKNKTGMFSAFFRAQRKSGTDFVVLSADKKPNSINYEVVSKFFGENTHLIHGKISSIRSLAFRLGELLASRIGGHGGAKFLYALYKIKYKKITEDAARYIEKHGKPICINVATSNDQASAIALTLNEDLRIPYVLIGHTDFSRRDQRSIGSIFVRKVYQSANFVVAVSPQAGRNLQAFSGKICPKITVIPNSIDDEFFQPPIIRQNWVDKLSDGRFVFAGWANWRSIKRLDLALLAFREVSNLRQNVCFIVAGQTPDWSKKMCAELGISDSVFFVGPLDRQKIHELAHGCDCCVIPSDIETFANPAIEALSAGKPVVTTRCGGPESIITHQFLGRVVSPGDYKIFASAMLETFDTRSQDLRELRRKYCMDNFSESAVARSWREFYDGI